MRIALSLRARANCRRGLRCRTLTTVSAPLLNTLTFLHSTQANGVHFGMWGWCLDDKEACSTIQCVSLSFSGVLAHILPVFEIEAALTPVHPLALL